MPPQWRPRQSHLAQRPGREKEKHSDSCTSHTEQHQALRSFTHSLTPLTHSLCIMCLRATRHKHAHKPRTCACAATAVFYCRGVVRTPACFAPFPLVLRSAPLRRPGTHWHCGLSSQDGEVCHRPGLQLRHRRIQSLRMCGYSLVACFEGVQVGFSMRSTWSSRA